MSKCILCESNAEKHHIKSRGSGGSDHDYNIMLICRSHHQEIHKIGRETFVNKYNLDAYMKLKKWEYIEVLRKWLPPRESIKSYE